MEDMTDKFVNMIEAFECDFYCALEGNKKITELQDLIENKNERLIKDIELLQELSFMLRHKQAKIVKNCSLIDELKDSED